MQEKEGEKASLDFPPRHAQDPKHQKHRRRAPPEASEPEAANPANCLPYPRMQREVRANAGRQDKACESP